MDIMGRFKFLKYKDLFKLVFIKKETSKFFIHKSL